jgi:hypothetical protein
MKRSIIIVAGLALTVGCGKRNVAHGSCETAIARGVILSAEDARSERMTPVLQDAARRGALVRCAADHWPDSALVCMTAAKEPDDYEACLGKVPAKDIDKLVDDMTAIMSAAKVGAVPDSGPARAPSGPSNGSSAGAGSPSAPHGP